MHGRLKSAHKLLPLFIALSVLSLLFAGNGIRGANAERTYAQIGTFHLAGGARAVSAAIMVTRQPGLA